jgi:Winged helix DNA-binding domain
MSADQYAPEVDALVAAVRERGELTSDELAKAVDARSWGSKRFKRAVDHGLLGGRLRRTPRDRYAIGAEPEP